MRGILLSAEFWSSGCRESGSRWPSTVPWFKPSQAELCRPMPLADHQRSAMDRELLAAYCAVMHFRHFLEGPQFTLFTDHKLLVAMIAKISDTRSAMQARHLAAISEFTTEVQHLEGKANVVADVLSRVEIDSAVSTLGIDFRELARAQQQDPEAGAVRTAITNLRLQDVEIGGHTLLCDVSQGRPRPLVPAAFRRTIFQALHSLSHPQGPKQQHDSWGNDSYGTVSRRTFGEMGKRVPCLPESQDSLACSGAAREGTGPRLTCSNPSTSIWWALYLCLRVSPTCWRSLIGFRDGRKRSPFRTSAPQRWPGLSSGQWVSRFGVTGRDNFWQRGPVHLPIVVRHCTTLTASLHQTTAYHPQSNVVMERNLVSDSNVSKHLGFFRENKKARIPSGWFRIFLFRETFWGNGGKKGRNERKRERILCKQHSFLSPFLFILKRHASWSLGMDRAALFFFSPLFAALVKRHARGCWKWSAGFQSETFIERQKWSAGHETENLRLVPSLGQWLGGAVSLGVEGFSLCLPERPQLGGSTTVGHVRNQGHTQGWHGGFPGRDGLWDSASFTIGQFCKLAGVAPAVEPFLHDLRRAMENLQPVPTSAHCKAAAEHVPEVLQKCPMVWIRRDGYRQPLTPRYKGPVPSIWEASEVLQNPARWEARQHLHRLPQASHCSGGHHASQA